MRFRNKGCRRAGDFEFKWLVMQLDVRFQVWAALASTWMAQQTRGVDSRQHALSLFFDRYLFQLKLPVEPEQFLRIGLQLPSFLDSACPKSPKGIIYNNYVKEFLDWVLFAEFSEVGPSSAAVIREGFGNPVKSGIYRKGLALSETVRNPLPYRFIVELRNIVAAGPYFRDWTWAHSVVKSDWFEVSKSQIDYDDPDCVWRERAVGQRKVFEMWSPVRFVAILTKLLVPLRTFQVRMLDSGESDFWRYDGGVWRVNEGPLASGSMHKPTRLGLFRRVLDLETNQERTALYINTNKTADIHRTTSEPGYVIPWQHEELLNLLEKLRNWQERYNPLKKPTAWSTLSVDQLGNAMSKERLASAPPTCFLFRQAAASIGNRDKPLPDLQLDLPWHSLLLELETRCASRGEKLASGSPLRFVYPGPRTKTTYYPMHSLRVSLLTCLALDGEVPLPILSKLVAGHSRLIMTLYYLKTGTGRVSNVLKEAEARMASTAEAGLQRFLEEASYEQLLDETVCNSDETLRLALSASPSERNATSWLGRSYGICLSGGNTSVADGKRIAGCHNGGPTLSGEGSTKIYGAVPGGSGNCVRCRWLVTEPRYLDALRAHFNNISYRLSESAAKARGLEVRLDAVKAQKAEMENNGAPFTEQAEYLRLERQWETSIAETDGLANDLVATLRLISRCLELLQRSSDDSSQQLVSAGSLADVRMALEETDSELLQLAEVCEDAEFYPDEPWNKAILRRSQLLDSALYREGVAPIFLSFSEEEQLRIGNHLVNRLKKLRLRGEQAPAGLKRIAGIIESQQRLSDVLDIEPGQLLDFDCGTPTKKYPVFMLTNDIKN